MDQENKKKLDEINTNILLNPSWGQAVKGSGLESQSTANKPRQNKSKDMLSLKSTSILGIKKKKEAFLNRLKLNGTASVRHLPQPPLGTSFGHGLL